MSLLTAIHSEEHNGQTSRFLQLPQELLERIYDYVYDDQIFRLYLSANAKARISHLRYRHPLALPSTCCKLRRDTANYRYTKTTFRILTFKFISMFDSWRVAIRHNPNLLLDFLESVPAPWMEHIEVIGVAPGPWWLKGVAQGPYWLNLSEVKGHKHGIGYRNELEETVRMVYPEANITFRTVDCIGKI